MSGGGKNVPAASRTGWESFVAALLALFAGFAYGGC
jgi:hypothetical protein